MGGFSFNFAKFYVLSATFFSISSKISNNCSILSQLTIPSKNPSAKSKAFTNRNPEILVIINFVTYFERRLEGGVFMAPKNAAVEQVRCHILMTNTAREAIKQHVPDEHAFFNLQQNFLVYIEKLSV